MTLLALYLITVNRKELGLLLFFKGSYFKKSSLISNDNINRIINSKYNLYLDLSDIQRAPKFSRTKKNWVYK